MRTEHRHPKSGFGAQLASCWAPFSADRRFGAAGLRMGGGLVVRGETGLSHSQRGRKTRVGVVVVGVGHRGRIHVGVRRQLRLDVRKRDLAAEAHQRAFHVLTG